MVGPIDTLLDPLETPCDPGNDDQPTDDKSFRGAMLAPKKRLLVRGERKVLGVVIY
jgi:hypothetical protein